MATIWEQYRWGSHYQVRSAGRSVRLYTDGVFHSQYNPQQPLTGSVWDLLLLPAFFYPPAAVQRVLMLGVGGGTVIRQLAEFVQPSAVVGIELNPVHIYIARRFFGVRLPGVRLLHADARQWIDGYGGQPFDLIIDDIFGGSGGDPQRPFPADPQWFHALSRRLSPTGTLVFNFDARDGFRRCGYFQSAQVKSEFATAHTFTSPAVHNVVAAFSRIDADAGALRRRLREIPALDTRRSTCRLRYRVRKLNPARGEE